MLDENVSVHASNIGGIDETTVELSTGVTVLAGRNATNRTSFLQAVMAGLGSEHVPLKADSDDGHVELSIGDQTYTRTATRKNGTVMTGGDPYLDDPELAELFAFLLSTNEARLAVERGDDLREIIMEPIDTEAIQSEIHRAEAERDQFQATLEEIEDLERKLPDLEEDRQQILSDIEETREALEEKQQEIETADADVEESHEEKAELDDTFDELNDARSDLEEVRFKLETERESIEALESEREELQSELEDIGDHPTEHLDEIESRLDRLRNRDSSLESDLSELGNVIRFNEDQLESESGSVWSAAEERNESAGSITYQLVEDEATITCWTCGTEVEADRIEATLDRLRELRQHKLEERDELREELESLNEERREIREQRQRREQLERRIENVTSEIADREATIEELEDRREDLRNEVELLEDEVEELEGGIYSDVLELHREANQLEFELQGLESDLDDVENEIDRIQSRVAERDGIEEQLEAVKSELTDLRTKIDQIESQAVEQFNEHMDEVLERLEYANIERIWIERIDQPGRDDRRSFDLHVVRSTETGAAYEDTIHHLSESEREVTGLVFALAGFLVHEVYETCPFMLLDSLETIDADRISALVDYLSEYTDYLVVALLPEDAAALDESYRRVTSI